jgi:hypothetical protein
MRDFFGVLAFASLIAGQFLAVVVAYSEPCGSEPPGRQRYLIRAKRERNTAPLVSSVLSLLRARIVLRRLPHAQISLRVDATNLLAYLAHKIFVAVHKIPRSTTKVS